MCISGVFDSNQYTTASSDSSAAYHKVDIDAVIQEAVSKPVDFVLSGEWAAKYFFSEYVRYHV